MAPTFVRPLLSLILIAGSAGAAAASPIIFTANLNGPSESPANASPGTGFAEVVFDTVANTMRVEITFSDLLGTTTASQIHCCTAAPLTGTAGVVTTTPSLTGFALGVTSGNYDQTFDMGSASSYNPAFVSPGATAVEIATAEALLLVGMFADESYLDIDTNQFPGGEIRGFLVAVPEPATLALFGIGLAGLGLMRRRKRVSPADS